VKPLRGPTEMQFLGNRDEVASCRSSTRSIVQPTRVIGDA